MEQLSGGGTRFRHQNHRRSPPSAERFLGVFQPESSSSAASALELSEHDIFSTPSADSSPSPTHTNLKQYSSPSRSTSRNNFGIFAALNGNLTSGSVSGSDTRPVFNHKASASASASLSSSASTSPATSTLSRIMIPRPPPRPQVVDRVRFHHQSAPVNVPVMPAALRRRARDQLDDVVSDEEEEEEDRNGMILPPHEMVAARHSPILACSVMEGTGRTLKGRDLRQVRNAIFRKTGFID